MPGLTFYHQIIIKLARVLHYCIITGDIPTHMRSIQARGVAIATFKIHTIILTQGEMWEFSP